MAPGQALRLPEAGGEIGLGPGFRSEGDQPLGLVWKENSPGWDRQRGQRAGAVSQGERPPLPAY